MRWIAYGGVAALLAGCAETEPRAALGEACDEATPCVAGAFCASESGACGGAGRCRAVEEACEGEERSACGCDGAVHESRCAAAMVGLDVQYVHACEAPEGMFGCGDRYCRRGSQYCEMTWGGGSSASDWLCRELACEGDAQGCACLSEEAPCAEDGVTLHTCEATEDGGTLLFCLMK